MKDRTPLDDALRGASNRVLIDALLPPMRLAARRCGYALAVHGSLCRDVDLVAVPWVDGADSADDLVSALVGAIGGAATSCCPVGSWTTKPHGRIAKILTVFAGGFHTTLDLSVMPAVTQGATP